VGGGDEARLDLGRRRAVDNDDDDLGDAARARAQASARAQERQRPGRAQRHDRQPTCARVRARLEPTSAPHGSRRAARSLCVESITVILKSLYSCNET